MKICLGCQTPFEKYRASKTAYCRPCDSKKQKTGRCIDCGENIAQTAKRCWAHANLAKKGAGNHNWTGGRVVDSNGYVVLSDLDSRAHPNAWKGKRPGIFEHVKVMSDYLGRPLLAHENVHHKNGDRQDNRIENLELWSRSQPAGQRVQDKVEWAWQIIKLYDENYLGGA